LFKVTSSKHEKWFYYFWTKQHLDSFISIAEDKATTMGHIKRGHLEKALVLIPDETKYREISDLLNSIIETIIVNRVQSRALAAIRDALLPKLMSGEIEVGEEI
jgi:type I restriction enzyme S subunit